jgi:predicted HTH transcriptional regulator
LFFRSDIHYIIALNFTYGLKKQHYIKELISQGEGLHLDFKFEISDASKIARSLVAFANTGGGKLLIGVSDEGIIKGIQSAEEFHMIENAANNYCSPKVQFNSKEWNIKGKKVLEIDIPFSMNYPHKAPDQNGNYKAYIRYEDQNLLADSLLIKLWNKEKNQNDIQLIYTEELRNILLFIEQNEPVTVNDILSAFHLSKFNTEHLLTDLVIFDVLKMDMLETTIQFYLTDNNDI